LPYLGCDSTLRQPELLAAVLADDDHKFSPIAAWARIGPDVWRVAGHGLAFFRFRFDNATPWQALEQYFGSARPVRLRYSISVRRYRNSRPQTAQVNATYFDGITGTSSRFRRR